MSEERLQLMTVLGGRVVTNVRMLPEALRANRPNRQDCDVAAEVVEQLLGLVDMSQALEGAPPGTVVQRVDVRRGDTLVVFVESNLSREMAEHLNRAMSNLFPDQRCVVIDGGARLAVLETGSRDDKTEVPA